MELEELTAVFNGSKHSLPGRFAKISSGSGFACVQNADKPSAFFDGGGEVCGGHAVKANAGGEESVGGQDVVVGVEDEGLGNTLANAVPGGH